MLVQDPVWMAGAMARKRHSRYRPVDRCGKGTPLAGWSASN